MRTKWLRLTMVKNDDPNGVKEPKIVEVPFEVCREIGRTRRWAAQAELVAPYVTEGYSVVNIDFNTPDLIAMENAS